MKILSIVALTAFSIIIVIIGSDFLWLWLPIAHSSEYPTKIAALFMAVTALFTLFLAFATFKTIEQSNLKEQERRKDNIEKENRDRKERWVNEIIDWASNTLNLGPTAEAGVLSLTGVQITIYQYAKINTLLIGGKHIYFISKSLDKKLEYTVKDTLSNLSISFVVTNNMITNENELREKKLTPEQHAAKSKSLTGELVNTEINLTKSANEVIRIASDIKSALLL